MTEVPPDTGYTMQYYASILLPGNIYEAELDRLILGSLRESPAAMEIAAPAILPGTPNRTYFIERFLLELAGLPFACKILSPQQERERQLDGYEEGRPDPTDPRGIWRAMSLDMQMELRGKRDAKLFFREFADGELVCISIAFDPSGIHGGRWRKDAGQLQESDLPRFRDFLCALIDAYPAVVATLGLDIIAVSPDLPHGENRLDNGKLLHDFLSKARREGREDHADCIFIESSHWGFDKPFVYDCIEPGVIEKGCWAGRQFYDMHRVEEMRAVAERAEQAYDRMYESSRPKDDKDDALGFLAKAIEQAAELGLGKEADRMRSRYEHINNVYNAQFRR